MNRSPSPSPRAFTLIELIVVVVILAVIAGVILPRFTASPGRRAETSAILLADLLSAAGTREALTSQPVAVEFDSKTNTASLLDQRSRSPLDWNSRAEWAPDPLSPPVTLDDADVLAVGVDGVPVDPARWRIEFTPGTARPAVRVVVGRHGASQAWRLDLPRGSMRTIVEPTDRTVIQPPIEPLTVDLGSTGRGIEPW